MVHDSGLPEQIEESELPAVLDAALARAADDGVTVITRAGNPIAAVMSMNDHDTVEDEIDRRLAARPRPADDGTRYSLADLLAEHAEGDR
ncbi:hypothetical protein ACL02R_05315 [Streptomyces sp. MS19]|uniref:hypothetical protein n=1 Tax=Streptomyces sp. MS19 TaxID=3385972 RepID=UPI00399F8CFB